MSIWAGDPLADTGDNITVNDWFLGTGGSIASTTKVRAERYAGKWYVTPLTATSNARWIKFSATEDFTAGESNVTIDGITYYDGTEPDTAPTSVENPG